MIAYLHETNSYKLSCRHIFNLIVHHTDMILSSTFEGIGSENYGLHERFLRTHRLEVMAKHLEIMSEIREDSVIPNPDNMKSKKTAKY